MWAALLPIIAELIPGLIKAVSTSSDDAPLQRMAEAVKNAAGSDDPAKVQQALNADQNLKQNLQTKLAEIALEELKERNRAVEAQREIDLDIYRDELEERDRAREDEFRQYVRDLQDRQEARRDWVSLAEDRNPLAWVGPIIALALLSLIAYCLHGIMIAQEPIINKDVFNTVLGALVTALTTVVSFYFGSSVGSRQKDNLVASGQLVSGAPPESTGQAAGSLSGRNPTPAPPSRSSESPKARTIPRGPLSLFMQKAPGVMDKLMRDLSITRVQAAGILGNIGHECAGFLLMQEQSPRGGRGGWGWCQWTGPRRRAFESFAADKGFTDLASDEANYGYLLHELKGPENAALQALRKTNTVESATTVFETKFERAGVQAMDRRINLANIALREYGRAYDA